jgi:hypothetical protein
MSKFRIKMYRSPIRRVCMAIKVKTCYGCKRDCELIEINCCKFQPLFKIKKRIIRKVMKNI